MHSKYLQAFINTMEKYKQGASVEDTVKKLVYYGVNIVNTRPKDDAPTRKRIDGDFQFDEIVLGAICFITPRELLNIFPLEKRYDGEKWEAKDYFTSMEAIEKHGMDKPIGDAMTFLWDYMNRDLRKFTINILSTIDHKRNLQGQPSMMVEFMAEHGIKPLSKYTDDKGREFLVDSEGKALRVKKKFPRYLRPVELI